VFDLENRKDYNIHNQLNIASNTTVASLARLLPHSLYLKVRSASAGLLSVHRL
jgi:hypothetical protein